jgi:CHAD domain-containing protein
VHGSPRQLVLADADESGLGTALAVPGSAFAWAADGRPRTLRRVWLDTFDWRLYRSGLTLEQVSSRGSVELTLTGRDGGVLAAEHPGRIRWPLRLDALPAGPLRDQLAPVAGVRALLPVARATSAITGRRVVNSDEKTVARVSVDQMSVSFPVAAALPPRLTVTPLRGYETQALRVTDLLAAAPGIADGVKPALEAALTAAGQKPGEYPGKADVRLTARMPAATALAIVLTALLNTVEANVAGTVRDVDTEFLHDLRIAVRRTRSALKLAGDVLPTDLVDRYRKEFRWLGDATTPTRDLDVYLLTLPEMTAHLVAGTAAELEPFQAHLAKSRAAAQRDLARALRSGRFSRLTHEWRHALETAPAGAERPSTARLAASRIARAHRRVLRDGRAITEASPPESLHDLRKRCKELRYLLEFFGSLYDPAARWQAARELKGLQDCLGEFQDTQVQRDELRAFAAQMMDEHSAPAATLLAMGEIAGRLATRERRARAEFAGRFRQFASPLGQSRIRALTGAAA